jgi:segregation and condensation protein B
MSDQDGEEQNGARTASAQWSLKIQAESLIFVASEPLSHADLARALAISEHDARHLIDEITADYAGRGIRLQRHGDQVQFVSAPEAAPAIERLLGLDNRSSRLSHAALETLAVVAYRQPVTRPEIEAIRGVDVSGALRTLQQRGLVAETGRRSVIGRPLLYGTTDEFLRQFGLGSLSDLPPLPEDLQQSPEHPGEDQAERHHLP